MTAIVSPPERRSVPEGGEAASAGSVWRLILGVFVQNKLAVVGLGIIVFVALFCFAGPLIYRTNQVSTNLNQENLAPSAKHPLGTNEVDILAAGGHIELAAQLGELIGPAEKTAGTVRMVVSRALSFRQDPQLATAILPAVGQEFDVDKFLRSGGTIYMIAKGTGRSAPLAPLFDALATEIEYRATKLGIAAPGRCERPGQHHAAAASAAR